MRALLPALMALAALAAAQPVSDPVESLHRQFMISSDEGLKREILERLERTPPVSGRDVSALFDIFSQYPDIGVRRSIMKSLSAIDPARAGLFEEIFLQYLQSDEPESVIFGINGALSLRLEKALPILHKMAKAKFPGKSPGALAELTKKNQWWVRYEVLSALAQWEGAKALPLLKSKAKEAPEVARIMALTLWRESLPQIVEWSASGPADQEKARFAAEAQVDPQALRDTRPRLLQILHDLKANRDLRHQIAIKVGSTSLENEVTELVKEYEVAPDKDMRLFLAAAVFASRSRQGVGILKQYAHDSPEPRARAAALFQLRDMLPAQEYRQLLQWAAKNDPDPDNRQDAQRQLSLP